MNPTPCIHATGLETLCESCKAEYDLDPLAWEEYGEHPAGIARHRELLDEIRRDMDRDLVAVPVDDEIPF